MSSSQRCPNSCIRLYIQQLYTTKYIKNTMICNGKKHIFSVDLNCCVLINTKNTQSGYGKTKVCFKTFWLVFAGFFCTGWSQLKTTPEKLNQGPCVMNTIKEAVSYKQPNQLYLWKHDIDNSEDLNWELQTQTHNTT